jgi:hypothetical protein
MLYYSNDPEIIEMVNKIFDNELTSTGRVNFSVCYSQNRTMSTVVIEMAKTPFVHSLTFYYSRSFNLYDVVRYKQKQVRKLGTSTSPNDEIQKLNKFILKKIPRSNQTGEKRIKEELLNEVDCVSKDYQIQSLKDRLKIANDTILSLQNKIKQLRKRNL